MVLSLFAGVGARSAKAAVTLTVAPLTGVFTGGTPVVAGTTKAIGTLTSTIGTTVYAWVNVTTAGVGTFPSTANVAVWRAFTTTVTSTDARWATKGDQLINFSATTGLLAGDEITCGTAIGTYVMPAFVGSTAAYVTVTTAGAAGALSVMRNISITRTPAYTPTIINLNSQDDGWKTVGSHQIAFNSDASVLLAGDRIVVSPTLVPANAGTGMAAAVTLSGTITTGNVVYVSWQDTLGVSHYVSYVVKATDTTLALVATGLAAAVTGTATAVAAGPVVTLTQTVAGVFAPNAVAPTAPRFTASVFGRNVTTLTIKTLGGLTQPAYVEAGQALQLVAVDQTGADVTATAVWTNAINGLVLTTVKGPIVVTATFGSATASFVVMAIPDQTITGLTIKLLVPADPTVKTRQFAAIASSATYAAIDYTTQSAWTDDLPVASVDNAGLLTYSVAETGHVYASAGGFTATANVTIDAAGLVTMTTTSAPVTRVIVLTIGTDIVTVDGKATSVDAAPEIVNGRTFVPIRFIAETFGATVTWLPETQGVTIVLGDTTIGLQIGNKTVVINGNIIAVEAAPYIKNSRTMVPLRVISESFGGDVVWDPALRTITITYLLP
jgi:hypothetical protein